MTRTSEITKVYVRRYSDTKQVRAYVEWSDGSRTEGPASIKKSGLVSCGTHMQALFARAARNGLQLTVERF